MRYSILATESVVYAATTKVKIFESGRSPRVYEYYFVQKQQRRRRVLAHISIKCARMSPPHRVVYRRRCRRRRRHHHPYAPLAINISCT